MRKSSTGICASPSPCLTKLHKRTRDRRVASLCDISCFISVFPLPFNNPPTRQPGRRNCKRRTNCACERRVRWVMTRGREETQQAKTFCSSLRTSQLPLTFHHLFPQQHPRILSSSPLRLLLSGYRYTASWTYRSRVHPRLLGRLQPTVSTGIPFNTIQTRASGCTSAQQHVHFEVVIRTSPTSPLAIHTAVREYLGTSTYP